MRAFVINLAMDSADETIKAVFAEVSCVENNKSLF